MTREELRDYVEEQRNLDVIPYHVYSTLIDGIDTLDQELFNGMTNGELIQALFPNEMMIEQTGMCTYYRNMRFNTEWWNTPYKPEKGGE